MTGDPPFSLRDLPTIRLRYAPPTYEGPKRSYVFALPVAEFQLRMLSDRFERDSTRPHVFTVELLTFHSGKGFVFAGKRGSFRIAADDYRPVAEDPTAPYDLVGHDAARAFVSFRQRETEAVIAQVEDQLENGKLSFGDLRRVLPSAFDYPSIQRRLAQAFRENGCPKGDKGKRPTLTRERFELYNWVYYYKTSQRIDIDAACAEAIEKHPELVPASWRRSNAGNLRREVDRFRELWEYYAHLDF